jgi:hypothetical protein
MADMLPACWHFIMPTKNDANIQDSMTLISRSEGFCVSVGKLCDAAVNLGCCGFPEPGSLALLMYHRQADGACHWDHSCLCLYVDLLRLLSFDSALQLCIYALLMYHRQANGACH